MIYYFNQFQYVNELRLVNTTFNSNTNTTSGG
jgi:hypothetical protein